MWIKRERMANMFATVGHSPTVRNCVHRDQIREKDKTKKKNAFQMKTLTQTHVIIAIRCTNRSGALLSYGKHSITVLKSVIVGYYSSESDKKRSNQRWKIAFFVLVFPMVLRIWLVSIFDFSVFFRWNSLRISSYFVLFYAPVSLWRHRYTVFIFRLAELCNNWW